MQIAIKIGIHMLHINPSLSGELHVTFGSNVQVSA